MKKIGIAAACLLLLSSAAWAGGYVGASVGQADTDLAGDDTSWKVLGGYNFMEFMGVEGSYRDLGGSTQTIGTTLFGFDASSLDLFGVGRYPVGEKFELFAKAGMAFVDVESTITDPLLGTISVSDSESEFAFGAGFNYLIGQKFSLRGEYESFDYDVLSFGGVYRF